MFHNKLPAKRVVQGAESNVQLCSTIEIKEKLFDKYKKLWCLTENWQLLNIKLVELNQGGDNDRLILISTFFIEHKFCGNKSRKWFCSTKNVKFNNGQKLYIFW